MTVTHAAIPFRNHLEMTAKLVNSLDGCEVIHLFDNGSDEGLIEPLLDANCPVMVYRCPDATLTQMWNEAWGAAEDWCADNLAILNNDITVDPGFLATLTAALRSDPDLWVVCPGPAPTGPYNEGVTRVTGRGVGTWALTGWAFMVRVEARQMGLDVFDEQFSWWYGDNDLALQVGKCGAHIGQVVGLPCVHQTSTTINTRPELNPQIRLDGERFRAKWGRNQ